MVFRALMRHLPPRLAVPVGSLVYSAGLLVLWWRWELPSAPFRYVGF